jgi:hypothetical protein
MGAPLLNQYKGRFALKRIVSTLTGCVLAPDDTIPLLVFIITLVQALVFISPFLASIIVYAANAEALTFGSTGNIILGVILALIHLACQLVATGFYSRSHSKEYHSAKIVNTEDGYVLNEDRPFLTSLKYIFVDTVEWPPLPWIHFVIKTFVAGIFASACSAYLNPTSISARFQNSGLGWALYIFGWFSACVAQFSLTKGPVPEPNAYKAGVGYGLDHYSRVFHLSVLIVCWGLESQNSSLIAVNDGLLFVFALFPFLWTCGLIPCFTILINVVAESVHHTFSLLAPSLSSFMRSICKQHYCFN